MTQKYRHPYLCPNCNESKLYFPDIKGKWGWLDITKMFCLACSMVFPIEQVKQYNILEELSAPGREGG